MKINKKNFYKIAIVLISILIYIMYVYYYYKNLNLESFVNHTVGSINILGKYLYHIFDKLISSESLARTIVISATFIFLLKDVDLSKFINSISGLEAYGVKISKEAAIQEKLNEDEKIRSIESSNDSSKGELDSAKLRKEIIALLIDNEKLVTLIEKYLITSRPIKIPLTSIPRLYKLETLGKIFEYKPSAGSIKIISIKKEIEPILIDVYNELKEKNIIYCEV